MTTICNEENNRYNESLRNFIDSRAALVLSGLLIGNKKLPPEQALAIKKTESDFIKAGNELNECVINRIVNK